MKMRFLVLVPFLFVCKLVLAQGPGRDFDSQKLQDAKIAFITSRLDLTPDQAEKFWPIFNQFSDQREANLKKMAALNPRRESEKLSESQAQENINQRFALQKKMIQDEEKFVKEISGVITYSQILQLHGLSRDFARMIYQRQRKKD